MQVLLPLETPETSASISKREFVGVLSRNFHYLVSSALRESVFHIYTWNTRAHCFACLLVKGGVVHRSVMFCCKVPSMSYCWQVGIWIIVSILL